MKKKNFKLIAVIAAILLSLSLFSMTASAEDIDSGTENTEISDTGTTEPESATDEAAEAEPGIFTSLFTYFEENSEKIFSALSFIGSLFIMITYKSGLLPLVERGISSLAGGVKKIGERAEELGGENSALSEALKEKLDRTEELLERMQNSLKEVDSRLEKSEADSASREHVSTVLMAEIDMLYEIFMAASLPQYLKERVGERVSEMKRALAEKEENEA